MSSSIESKGNYKRSLSQKLLGGKGTADVNRSQIVTAGTTISELWLIYSVGNVIIRFWLERVE